MDLGNGALPPQRQMTPRALKRAASQHRRAMRRAFKGIMPRREAQALFYGALTARERGRA